MGNTLKNGASVKLCFTNCYLAQVVILRESYRNIGEVKNLASVLYGVSKIKADPVLRHRWHSNLTGNNGCL